MGVKRLIRVTTFLIAASVGAWNVGASADVLEDAEKLIAAGQHAAALELLEPLEDDRAGDPKFDYLLGIAYVDTGRPTLGVFALERVVDVQPNNAAARAELARAYFLLNEKDAAKLEFETAKKQKAPASVQATINKYLAAINQRSLAEKGGFSGYLEGSAGYDSNVNSATEDRLLGGLNPATRNFVLNKNSREQSSAFVGALGAGRYTHALRSDLDLFVGGFINAKENTSARFDTLTTSAEVGLQHLRGRDQFRASINGLLFWVTNPLVSHDINTRRHGISGEWRRGS